MIEIGDKFVIDHKGIKKIYKSYKPCEFPNLEFTIVDFSKSKQSVYFIDKRTNPKCKCNICGSSLVALDDRKCIGVAQIIITQSRICFERDKKLKQILPK